MASLRNLAIGILHAHSARNIAAAPQRPQRHPSPATPWHHKPVNQSFPPLPRPWPCYPAFLQFRDTVSIEVMGPLLTSKGCA
jgi:hypothetical protein